MAVSQSTLTYSDFLKSYCPHQPWSIPSSIIYYITKNPSTSKCYQKLIKSCKYFYIKNPIIVIQSLIIAADNKWKIISKKDQKQIDFSNFSTSKFWLTENFDMFFGPPSKNAASMIIPKFYRINVKYLSLTRQEISLKEFLLISSNVVDLYFNHVVVVNDEDDDTVVTLQKIVESVPTMKVLLANSPITENTVKELLCIPHFSKMEKFHLYGVSEIFDIEIFYKYIKKNKETKFMIYFAAAIPNDYKNHLEEIIDEILETENRDFEMPHIYFNGISDEKYNKMKSLFSGASFK